MLRLNMFYATEARTKFFKLIKMVAQGEEVIVINKDSGFKIKLVPLDAEISSGKKSILKQLADADFKSKSPEEIKRIIENRLNNE
ncbi:type II toxin-antitoxin system prevent-host-death family antitoxin [Candidatus Daviesbacteria bacterium]|nr:type II toxin-antitoxin system prevent-host-death family antitoxin [Candidatus Daviesbacteria bacterium]